MGGKKNNDKYTGFLNIYKEAGFTSFDVVAKLRGILGQKKIGHLGTLDPQAVGVLPVALGKATRAISLLEDHTKAYDAEILLGKSTDTYDIWGEVIEERSVDVSEEDTICALKSFEGESLQIPPMYSAKKVNGRKLYELAREGKVIEREPVPITIYSIEIQEISLPYIKASIECSAGTYIRSICHDLGQKLGCGACMSALERTRAGAFDLSTCVLLNDLQSAKDDNYLVDYIVDKLIPIDKSFNSHPQLFVDKQSTKLAKNGNPLTVCNLEQKNFEKSDFYRVYCEQNLFLGIYEWRGKKLCPRKVFL